MKMKKNIIKKPVYKLNDMNEEIHSKFFSVSLLGAFLFLIVLFYGILNKDIVTVLSSFVLLLFAGAMVLYIYYMFAYDKVGVIEGSIYKVVNRKGIYAKYKDIYIRTEDGNTFVMTISKFKRDYSIGVYVRMYISPTNIIQDNQNTWKARNPIIMKILSAEYEEGESDDNNDKIKKPIFRNNL